MDGKESLKTLAAMVDRDHPAMNRLLEDVLRFTDAGATVPAMVAFNAFRGLFAQHMGAEEDLLATLELEGRCPRHLAQRVNIEHRQLEGLIAATATALATENAEGFSRSFENLARALSAHERMEGDLVLPTLCACFASPSSGRSGEAAMP